LKNAPIINGTTTAAAPTDSAGPVTVSSSAPPQATPQKTFTKLALRCGLVPLTLSGPRTLTHPRHHRAQLEYLGRMTPEQV